MLNNEKLPLTKLLELPMDKIEIYNLAWKMLTIGYYSHADFVKYLKANNVRIF